MTLIGFLLTGLTVMSATFRRYVVVPRIHVG
jgi:hypothetical protein